MRPHPMARICTNSLEAAARFAATFKIFCTNSQEFAASGRKIGTSGLCTLLLLGFMRTEAQAIDIQTGIHFRGGGVVSNDDDDPSDEQPPIGIGGSARAFALINVIDWLAMGGFVEASAFGQVEDKDSITYNWTTSLVGVGALFRATPMEELAIDLWVSLVFGTYTTKESGGESDYSDTADVLGSEVGLQALYRLKMPVDSFGLFLEMGGFLAVGVMNEDEYTIDNVTYEDTNPAVFFSFGICLALTFEVAF